MVRLLVGLGVRVRWSCVVLWLCLVVLALACARHCHPLRKVSVSNAINSLALLGKCKCNGCTFLAKR